MGAQPKFHRNFAGKLSLRVWGGAGDEGARPLTLAQPKFHRNFVHKLSLRVWTRAWLVLVFLTGPALAVPEMNTIKLDLGDFEVIGTYTTRSCAAQVRLRSAQRQSVGFSIYWRPGKQLNLLTQHPRAAQANGNGRLPVQFRFPSGQAMAFDMTLSSDRVLFTNIGFGKNAKAFYKLIEANPSLRIEWPALNDTVTVSLDRRRELESAMRHCRDWLKS